MRIRAGRSFPNQRARMKEPSNDVYCEIRSKTHFFNIFFWTYFLTRLSLMMKLVRAAPRNILEAASAALGSGGCEGADCDDKF